MAKYIFIYLFDCNCIYAHFRRPRRLLLLLLLALSFTIFRAVCSMCPFVAIRRRLAFNIKSLGPRLSPPATIAANELVIDFT